MRRFSEGIGRIQCSEGDGKQPRPLPRSASGVPFTKPSSSWRLLSFAWTAAVFLARTSAGAAETAVVAEGPSKSGWEVAFRTGAIFPAGDLVPGSQLSVGVGVEFPLVVDVGYRIDEHFFLGVVGQYAFGTVGSGSCDQGASCLVMNGRVGPEVQIHPLGRLGRLDPWFGLGFGYEWQLYRESTSGFSDTLTVSGFDFLNVDLGIDFPVGKVHLGPYVGFTIGEFDHANDSGKSNSIDDKALHYWFSVGIKLTVFP
jgi:hypothetical protein